MVIGVGQFKGQIPADPQSEASEASGPRAEGGRQAPTREQRLNARQVMIVTVALVALAVVALVFAELAYKVVLFVKERWQGRVCRVDEKTHKFFEPLIHKLKVCTGWDSSEIGRRVALSSEDERAVIAYLQNHFELSTDELKEIRRGAHVSLDDGGKAYKEWEQTLGQKVERRSSHPSDKPQFAVRGPLVSELLFGERDGCSWFQMESSPLAFGTVLSHFKDYIVHVVTGKNIGPDGRSHYTHHQPMVLRPKLQVNEAISVA